jgi:hypothetical protein
MEQQAADGGEHGFGKAIQDLLVSGIRLSAGLTLFGIGQIQKVLETASGDRGIPGATEKLGSTFDALSQSLESNLNESRREAVQSVSRVSAKAIEKAFETFSPDAILEAGNRLLGRRDDASPETAPASASLAVDVLSGPPGT